MGHAPARELSRYYANIAATGARVSSSKPGGPSGRRRDLVIGLLLPSCRVQRADAAFTQIGSGLPVSRNDLRLDSTRGQPFVMPCSMLEPGIS